MKPKKTKSGAVGMSNGVLGRASSPDSGKGIFSAGARKSIARNDAPTPSGL